MYSCGVRGVLGVVGKLVKNSVCSLLVQKYNLRGGFTITWANPSITNANFFELLRFYVINW
jgi:hypothetical protein